HLENYKTNVNRLYKKMTALSVFRLIVFVLTIVGIYVMFGQWQITVAIAIIGIVLFLYLLLKYNDAKSEKLFNEALVKINKEEINIASGDFHNRNDGLQFQDPTHFYSLDIDLFGRGSFFQFINRTTINEGAQELANALKENNIKDIVSRQEAIKELSSKPEWRQFYAAKSSLIQVETPTIEIIKWLKNHQSFLPKFASWLPMIFSIASILIFVLINLNI